MKHKTASSFWMCYGCLPIDIRNLADKNFQLLKADSSHPSLHFKKVGKVWSARVGSNYRAVATPIEDGFLWVWIGTHAEYDKLLA
ncbi:MAG: type II toxin-antitoxin system HigB family toxin [Methylovulum sp.]|nr:type II toxin-antitoxin system HigB family toxin [Methylovulum sp.]MCF7999588.1 type II toxin-antitoxin system HigB family toxin [Methylovulum sp.]